MSRLARVKISEISDSENENLTFTTNRAAIIIRKKLTVSTSKAMRGMVERAFLEGGDDIEHHYHFCANWLSPG